MRTVDDLTEAQQQLAADVLAAVRETFGDRGELLAQADADAVDKRAVALFWFGPHAMDEVAW